MAAARSTAILGSLIKSSTEPEVGKNTPRAPYNPRLKELPNLNFSKEIPAVRV